MSGLQRLPCLAELNLKGRPVAEHGGLWPLTCLAPTLTALTISGMSHAVVCCQAAPEVASSSCLCVAADDCGLIMRKNTENIETAHSIQRPLVLLSLSALEVLPVIGNAALKPH